jgi:3-oxoacyl-[acyl-carrier-protein] synthase-3
MRAGATSDLCLEACRRCLRNADVPKADVDLLIVATHTPDLAMPGTVCLVQEKLGLFCGAFDVQAACAGFMVALAVGAQFVKTGSAERCLVVGADVSSRIVNPADQGTYPLFGDGAGAVLLAPGGPEQGFLAYQLGTEGSGADLLGRRQPDAADGRNAASQSALFPRNAALFPRKQPSPEGEGFRGWLTR